MPRHKLPSGTRVLPEWVKALPENAACLRSVAEETYMARNLAKEYGADSVPSCAQKARCEAGSRAYRKFREAKVCARRV